MIPQARIFCITGHVQPANLYIVMLPYIGHDAVPNSTHYIAGEMT